MAKKLVALFVMCVIAVAALRGCEASDSDKYNKCFITRNKDCLAEGNGNTYCEVKSDEECTAKEEEDNLSV